MDERVLTPSTSVLTVLVVGMVAGHVLMPGRPGSAHRAAFVLAVAAAGALGGWRVGRLFARHDHGRAAAASVAGAALALALAWLAWRVVHGG